MPLHSLGYKVTDHRAVSSDVEGSRCGFKLPIVDRDPFVMPQMLCPGVNQEHLEVHVGLRGVTEQFPPKSAVAKTLATYRFHCRLKFSGTRGIDAILHGNENGCSVGLARPGQVRFRPMK